MVILQSRLAAFSTLLLFHVSCPNHEISQCVAFRVFSVSSSLWNRSDSASSVSIRVSRCSILLVWMAQLKLQQGDFIGGNPRVQPGCMDVRNQACPKVSECARTVEFEERFRRGRSGGKAVFASPDPSEFRCLGWIGVKVAKSTFHCRRAATPSAFCSVFTLPILILVGHRLGTPL